MPDEMVEKAQTLDDAIDNALIAWGMGWDMDGVMACLKEAKDRAALSAAHAEPVATEAAIKADERDMLAEMGKHTNWELSCSGGWTDDPARWIVHEVTGGRNDREWTEIGSGATPAEAIATAIRARGETAPNAKRPDPA